MRHWSANLETEINSWPAVTSKPMFGFQSHFRGGRIFAAIPRSRGFGSPSSLMLKFDAMPPALFTRAQKDPRFDATTRTPGKGWFGFELTCDADLRDALWWLNKSYENCKK